MSNGDKKIMQPIAFIGCMSIHLEKLPDFTLGGADALLGG